MSARSQNLSVGPENRFTDRPWWQLALLGGVAAAVLNLVVYAIAVGVADVNLQTPTSPGSDELQDLPIVAVVLASFLPALLAAGLAALLAARTTAPSRWFLGIAVALLLLSFVTIFPLDVSTGAKVTLAIMHVAAAAAIVAGLAPRLAAEERRSHR